MKTIRTILATFGVTSLLYGLLALVSMRLDLAYTGRSIYQLFRSTGFSALVLGIGCILSFIIMTIAIVAFRDDGSRKKRDALDDEDDELFLDEETVPAERADEADEAWSPEIKRKQRKALLAADEDEEPETPELFSEDEDEEENAAVEAEPEPVIAVESRTPEPEPETEPEPEQAPEPEEEPEPEPEPEEEPEEEPEPEAEPSVPQKRCIYCGELIDADSAFCNYCGKRV